jgi:hypothetical protein
MAFRARRYRIDALWDALVNERVSDAVLSIQAGDIDVNKVHEGKTPMQVVAENYKLAKPDLFEALLKAGSAVDDTCLYRACFKNNVAAVRLLLAAKAEGRAHFNVNIMHPDMHNTPLFLSVENQNPAICSLLLHDPDINPNSVVNGMTVLYYAVFENLFDIVELLLQNPRTDPNTTFGDDTTPLHIAVFKNHARCVPFLLSNPRIDITLRDRFDMTALDLAKRIGRADIVALIEGVAVPPSPPLATDPQIHQFHEIPQITDYISMEESPYTDFDDSYLIFKFGDVYFARTKESIRKDIYDAAGPPPPEDENDTRGDRIVFECLGELHGAPRREQINMDRRFFVLSGNGNYVIPLAHVLGALTHPTNTFEIVGPVRQLNFVTSYGAVLVEGALGFQRRPVNTVSRDHCQADTAKQLYELHPLQLQAPAAPVPAAAPAAPVPAAPAAAAPRRGGRRTTRRPRHRRAYPYTGSRRRHRKN